MNASGHVSLDSLAGTAVLAKAGKCVLTAAHAINTTAGAAHLQLFDAAAASDVTLGSTLPRWVVSSAASVASGPHNLPADGLVFELGIVAASTTTALGNTGAIQHARLAIK